MNEIELQALNSITNKITTYLECLKTQLTMALDKQTSLNGSAFSMYLGNVINLENILSYELQRYGSTGSENEMEVYKSLQEVIDYGNHIVKMNDFQYDEGHFNRIISFINVINDNELNRYIFNSLPSV